MHISEEDRSLLAQLLHNDRKSQEILYRKYFPVMLSMCRRYSQDEGELISIINDGFLRVFKKIDKYHEEGSFEGWMKRLVFNALSDYFKKENRRQKFVVLDKQDQEQDPLPIDELYLDDLNQMIDMLSQTTKDIFIMYSIEGYTHKEIGERLGIAEGTSKWHLNKARNELKEIIKRQNRLYYHGS